MARLRVIYIGFVVAAAAVGIAASTAAPTVATATVTAAATTADERLDLIVAATTDLHGWLRGWNYFANGPDSTRGITRVATIVDSLRAANRGRVLLVDAGDILQGTPVTSIALQWADSARTNPLIAAMNAAGYDAAAIGNHEFNYGLPYLRRAIAEARFPLLAANVRAPDGSHAFKPWVMREVGGPGSGGAKVRVAIVGGTTPGSMIWDRDKLVGRVQVGDVVPAVRDAVTDARAHGADVVVVLLHSGLGEPSSYDTTATGVASENVSARVAREVPGIDLIVFGHTHRELADTVIGTTLLTQPRNWAASVSVARLRLRRTNAPGRGWSVVAKEARIIRARGHAESRRVLAASRQAHEAAVAYVNAPIGTTPVAWRSDSARVKDTPIVDFVLEVERRTAGSDLASVAAFNLDAAFGPGPITVADMAELYPYENNVLRVVKISGRQLREYLEYSARYFRSGGPADSLVDSAIPAYNYDILAGADYVIDITKPVGSRITSLSRNGRPVADTDTFTLALHDYRQQGGGGYAMLRGAPLVYDRQQHIRQLLIDEVRRRGVLRPEDYFTPNWRLAPDTLLGAAYRSTRGPRGGAR